jgi:hypothetical protein
MQIPDEKIQEHKDMMKEKYDEDMTWEEAADSARNLLNFVDLLYDMEQKEVHRRRKLIDSPEGFHLDGTHTCPICRNKVSDEQTWYDEWGVKCMTCQRAINEGVVPGRVARDKSGWYSKFELNRRFNIHSRTVGRLVREDVLTARVIENDAGNPHEYVCLIHENRDVLPAKHATEHILVSQETKDGHQRHWSEPWYKFVDPQEYLKNYKMVEYMKVPESEGVDS